MPGKKWPTKEVRLPSTLRRAPFAIHSSAPIRLLRVSVTLKVEGFRGLVRRESPRMQGRGRLGRERATRTRGRFGNLRYSRLGGLRYVGATSGLRRGYVGRGTRNSMRVPAPGLDSTINLPPKPSRRVRRFCRPCAPSARAATASTSKPLPLSRTLTLR